MAPMISGGEDSHELPVSTFNGSGTVTASPHPAPDVQAVFESSPDALLVIAEDGTIRLVNAATERMFGYNRE